MSELRLQLGRGFGINVWRAGRYRAIAARASQRAAVSAPCACVHRHLVSLQPPLCGARLGAGNEHAAIVAARCQPRSVARKRQRGYALCVDSGRVQADPARRVPKDHALVGAARRDAPPAWRPRDRRYPCRVSDHRATFDYNPVEKGVLVCCLHDTSAARRTVMTAQLESLRPVCGVPYFGEMPISTRRDLLAVRGDRDAAHDVHLMPHDVKTHLPIGRVEQLDLPVRRSNGEHRRFLRFDRCGQN